MAELIRRVAPIDKARLRKEETGEGEKLTFAGHAAVFDQPTLIGSRTWGFVEWIEPGAFASVLEDDVRFLFNHDGLPLARTTNGTLKLEEDDLGLASEAELAPVQLSKDVATLVERGDLSQMSFAFYPGQVRTGIVDLKDREGSGLGDIDIDDDLDGMPYQAITSMKRLFDVSVVTYPAYEGTDAAMKSLLRRSDAMIKSVVERAAELRNGSMYDARLLRLRSLRRMTGSGRAE